MERQWIPETETRLTLLYCLDRLGPVTENQLLEFLVTQELLTWFDLRLNLEALTESGQAERKAHTGGALITLTEAGAYTVRSFSSRLPGSRRALIDAEAPRWRERFRLQRITPAAAETLPDGRRLGRLQLEEQGQVRTEAALVLPEGFPVHELQARWQQAAPAFLRRLTLLLSEGNAEQPAADAVLTRDGDDWLLRLGEPGRDPLALALRLHGDALARRQAANWPACAAALRQELLSALTAADPDRTAGT